MLKGATNDNVNDNLQIAAQLYPWQYMTSTLDACFQSATYTANANIAVREQQLAQDSASIADARARWNAEQAAEIYDALTPSNGSNSGAGAESFAEIAPRIMQAFLAHGEACEGAEAEAMKLALEPPSKVPRDQNYDGDGDEEEDWDAPLRVYAKMLETLETLYTQAQNLETSIVKLTGHLQAPDSESGSGSGSEAHSGDNHREPIHVEGERQQHRDATSDPEAASRFEGDDNISITPPLGKHADLGPTNSKDGYVVSAPAPAPDPAPTPKNSHSNLVAPDGDGVGDVGADTAQTQILRVFKACLPVLRARIANIVMAQDLVDGARENLSISLRMESLGLLDGGGEEEEDEDEE